MKIKELIFSTLSLTLCVSNALASEVVKLQSQPKIEAVFILDTTGSMGGLIQAAKEKIWSIASTLASTEPTPEVKVGLLGYRDRGDQYVTKRTKLTNDLDEVYSELMKFQAGGGGDGPESVNQALHEAIQQFSWSKDSNTYKVVFLVGDAPPHMDYQNDVKYTQSVPEASRKGIIINSIQCGSDNSTAPIWREIATLGEGQFFRVEQSGGAILAATPFDDKLAKLAHELDGTRLYYGSHRKKAEQKARIAVADSIYERAPSSALASRATWNASKAGKDNFAGDNELLSDLDSGSVALDAIEEEELPEELQGVSKEKREAIVSEKNEKRKEIQSQIEELSKKRQNYIASQVKDKKGDSLDEAIYSAIKKQAAPKGITYETGPKY